MSSSPVQSRESRLTLAATPSAPFWARRHTADILRRWELTDLTGTAELVTSELVTNGVKASGVQIDAGWDERGHEPGASAEGAAVRDEPSRSAASRTRVLSVPTTRTQGGRERRMPPPVSTIPHSRGGNVPIIRLRFWLDQARGLLLVEAWDQSPEPPILRKAELDSVSGRGLALVEAFCEQWGWWWPQTSIQEGRPWPPPLDKTTARTLRDTGAEWTAGKVVWGAIASRKVNSTTDR